MTLGSLGLHFLGVKFDKVLINRSCPRSCQWAGQQRGDLWFRDFPIDSVATLAVN